MVSDARHSFDMASTALLSGADSIPSARTSGGPTLASTQPNKSSGANSWVHVSAQGRATSVRCSA